MDAKWHIQANVPLQFEQPYPTTTLYVWLNYCGVILIIHFNYNDLHDKISMLTFFGCHPMVAKSFKRVDDK